MRSVYSSPPSLFHSAGKQNSPGIVPLARKRSRPACFGLASQKPGRLRRVGSVACEWLRLGPPVEWLMARPCRYPGIITRGTGSRYGVA